MEVFVHTRGKDVELHQPEPTAMVKELAEKVGHPDAHVFIEGAHEPVSPDTTLADAGISDRANVHVGVCKKVAVSVRYNQQTKNYEVPPSATLESIYARATSKGQGFGLSDADRTQYTLQIQGANDQPDLSRHVGAFANDNCAAAFDLVMQDRFQG
jgi:hypothetical protein